MLPALLSGLAVFRPSLELNANTKRRCLEALTSPKPVAKKGAESLSNGMWSQYLQEC